MSQSTVKVGIQCKMYYTVASSRLTWSATVANNIYMGPAPQSLVEATVVRNVTTNLTRSEGDGSSRASLYKLYLAALKDAGIDVEIPWTPSDPAFAAFRNAYFGDSLLPVLVLDGDVATSGNQGLWADMMVSEFTRDEPLEKEVMAKVKLKPTPSAVPPQWVIVN